jgi:hypothetical protein
MAMNASAALPLRSFAMLCVAACFTTAQASVPLDASLEELACGADHIFVGRVVGVDMVNLNGRQVRHPEAMTGPGMNRTIRLEVEVLERVESTEAVLPASVRVPLDPFMHYSLGQVKAAHTEPSSARLVFLRGANFQPVIAGRFFWSLEEKEEALKLRGDCRP